MATKKRKSWRFEVYRGSDGWRWRLRAGNHRIVAHSGEGYTSQVHTERMIRQMRSMVPPAAVVTK